VKLCSTLIPDALLTKVQSFGENKYVALEVQQHANLNGPAATSFSKRGKLLFANKYFSL